MKHFAANELGNDDEDSLIHLANSLEKQAKLYKWLSILIGVIGIPLCLAVIGFPIILFAILLYFFGYRKSLKRIQMFREHVKNDPELSLA